MKLINKLFNLIIVGLVLAYGGWFYFRQTSAPPAAPKLQKTDFSSVDVDRVVNKYLKQTSDQMIHDRLNSDRNVAKSLQTTNLAAKKITAPKPVEIPLEQQIYKEPTQGSLQSPISAGLEKDSKISGKPALVEGLDKKEYARQFIENARKGGYHIELNDDLSVRSVTPIRQPTSQEIDTFEILPSN